MRALVLLGGGLADAGALRTAASRCRPVIAADGGARHLEPLSVRPDLLVGDFDSIDPDLLRRLEGDGIPMERYPTDKDVTDSEIAFRLALDAGAEEILAVGALGSRPDHVLANQTLAARLSAEGVRVWLSDGRSLMVPLCGGTRTGRMDGQETGDFLSGAASESAVSLVPLTDVVRGIRTRGLAYPLENASMSYGSTLGVSNRPTGGWDDLSVSCGEGILLVVVTPAE